MASYYRGNSQDGDLKIDSLDELQSVSLQSFINDIDFKELEMLEIVGRGAFGVVQKACWRGCVVAVKTIESVNSRKEIQVEVQQQSSVQHKNIIQLFGTTVNQSNVCLVMEYADCGSLYNLLHPPDATDELVPYTFAHVMSWSLQCAEAVAYLHNVKPKPIVHRDLKPPNMLLTDQGVTLKICDFGTARDQATVMTSNKGSASWMAPEVFETTTYNIKCDVYSFGIVLWEMLTRKKPFEEIGPPAFRIMWAVHSGQRPPPIQNIPECLEHLMNSCWAKEQERRPAFSDIVKFFRIINDLVPGSHEPIFKSKDQDLCDCSPNWYDSSEQKTSIPRSDHDGEENPLQQQLQYQQQQQQLHYEQQQQIDSSALYYDEDRLEFVQHNDGRHYYYSPEPQEKPPNVNAFSTQGPVSPNPPYLHSRANSDPVDMNWQNGFKSPEPVRRNLMNQPYRMFMQPRFSAGGYPQYPPIDPVKQVSEAMRQTMVSPYHMFSPGSSPIHEENIPTETSPKTIPSVRRLQSEENIRKWRLVPPELMPVNPVDSDKASIQLYENYMEALKKYVNIQENIKFLRQRKDNIEKNLENEDQEQKRNSCLIPDFIRLQENKQSLTLFHDRIKSTLEDYKRNISADLQDVETII